MDWDAMMPEAEAVAEMLLQDFNITEINDADILQVIVSDRSAVIDLLAPREFPIDRAGLQEIFAYLVEEEILPGKERSFEGEVFSEDEVVAIIQSEASALLNRANLS